jgi:hypothetical protein
MDNAHGGERKRLGDYLRSFKEAVRRELTPREFKQPDFNQWPLWSMLRPKFVKSFLFLRIWAVELAYGGMVTMILHFFGWPLSVKMFVIGCSFYFITDELLSKIKGMIKR